MVLGFFAPAAAVLDLGLKREGTAARRRIVGIGVLVGEAVDERVDIGRRDPLAALVNATVAVPPAIVTV